MRFQISSVLWMTTSLALAIGWGVDRYTNRVPSYEERLSDHAILAATLADLHRLHSISDFPEAYIKRTPDMLFSTYIQLFQHRELFERTYGPIGNAKQIDAETLRQLGGETLRKLSISTFGDFTNRLAATGAWKNPRHGLYNIDGTTTAEIKDFVEECLKVMAVNSPTETSG